ncbi:UDP-glucose--hexose-1-phosphate uridylyltransferase [Paenibacillus sp. IB182496]|uniref:Galactose-1-phosphate uridylyltransferase n=1 Tax=Paenibacillus sabuli TaxID=2772509 RepID=A0A927GRF2_9BACL|nr:UDP-glucose--hexose-1-phosphate uridylyltransferase [Paenibacillus sabuli]MBD2844905.1 UDP-glucose--hexose-1-phosphate uridylyltransferase [Paenibacillus sabuli]
MKKNANTAVVSEAATASALEAIERLLGYGLREGMLQPLDEAFTRNALLELFGLPAPYEGQTRPQAAAEPGEALDPLLDYGAAIGLIPDNTTLWRDLLDARIMGLLLPRPSAVADGFAREAARAGVRAATDAFYRLNIAANYIRMDRVRRNVRWLHGTDYGELEMTINLSKPEKDPKEIALLKTLPQSSYPRCLLCEANVGYAGRADHPARQNLRVLPLTLQDEQWFFQYSPYVYYNEHSIVLRGEHVPMSISPATFARLLDFVEQFPHYFVGSNADLPIVGGSILNHDHFQGGRHLFAMEAARPEARYVHPELEQVAVERVAWPMSVVRMRSANRAQLLTAAEQLLTAWRGYSDPEVDILGCSEQEDGAEPLQHNTVTPIARLGDDGAYELDLVLRNNRTSAQHPDGIFHPHAELHHIKKENIGLIEVMGLAVLPGRLKTELEQLTGWLTGTAAEPLERLRESDHPLHAHAEWIGELRRTHGAALSPAEAEQVLQEAVGDKFLRVLLDAGVFKRTPDGAAAFERFLLQAGLGPA